MPKKIDRQFLITMIILVIIGFFIFTINNVHASIIDELKNRISDRNLKIQELEREIKQYQKDLDILGGEKQTLTNELKTLDISRQKIATDIKLTQNKIDSANLQIEELSFDIEEKKEKLDKNKKAAAKTLRAINEAESNSLVEIILSNDNLSGFLDKIETLRQFQITMGDDIKRLAGLKEELEGKKNRTEEKQKELANFKNDLSDQKYVLDINKKDKNALLDITKNKESNYQKLLAERKVDREQFEEDLRKLESQLQFELDPDSIPSAGKEILRWPLDKVYITQYFGNTKFAKNGAYKEEGHNGVDFRASEGTEVKAALGGEVVAVNSKVAYMCQYGKWVLIRHPNGLTTLYAHLSLVPDRIKVGQKVATGQVVGYSGSTGYSTGPHLHFTVYASKAVQFKEYTCKSGATLTIPVAAYSGYLNPMNYL